MRQGSAILLFPPGWGGNVGGPHLGLPLLQGYLEAAGHRVFLRDLNVDLFKTQGISLPEADTVAACADGREEALNTVYGLARCRLADLAEPYGGRWEVAGGYRPPGFDPASSDSVRRFSAEESPYSSYFLSQVIPEILKTSAEIVGLALVVPDQLLPTFELCRLLRNAGCTSRILLGGSLVTRIAREMALPWVFDLVDGLVSFQGEETLDLLLSGTNQESVPNLSWRRQGEIVTNSYQPLAKRLFREPSFSDIDLDSYWGVTYLPLVASRGCYYGKCTFCAIPFSWGKFGFLGHGQATQIVHTIETAVIDKQTRRFKFADESLSPSLLSKIADLLLERSLSIEFEGYARFDSFLTDRKLLDKFARSGLRKLYLGLEIVEGDTREKLNKSDPASMAESLTVLHDAGILVHLFCMFGFPGTGVKEAFDTVDFLLKHRQLIDTVDIAPFSYAKHTTIEGIRPRFDPVQDWALDYTFEPIEDGILGPEEVLYLAETLEGFLWSEEPLWLHPLYRMRSPWQSSCAAEMEPSSASPHHILVA